MVAFRVAVLSTAAGVAGVAGSYAIAGFTPDFVVAPVATFTSQAMPGVVVAFAITTFGELGDLLNFVAAAGLTIAVLAAAAAVGVLLGRRFDSTVVSVGSGTLLVGAVSLLVSAALPASLGAAVGAGVVLTAGELAAVVRVGERETVDRRRRTIIGSVATALGVSALGFALGGRRRDSSTLVSLEDRSGGADSQSGRTGSDGQRISDLLALASDRSLDVEGLEGLVSGDNFYEVDIYNVDPDIAAADWTLSIHGAVEEEVTLSYDDIRSMDAQHRFKTLRCVGEPLNGKKMDTALWTGVPIMDVIDRATPHGDTVVLRDGDGYYEEFSLDALRTGMLAYGMDGSTLPRAHGAPVRALVPGHWGEINVKWLTEIEVTEEPVTGYWEKRGWHGTGPVNTVAKLHVMHRLPDGHIQVGGHAYAGIRGVEQVSVSIDGGETWDDATLSTPLPAAYATDVWRQWVFEYDPAGETHEVVVRATDGTGAVQPQTAAAAYPNGASGWVSRTIDAQGKPS